MSCPFSVTHGLLWSLPRIQAAMRTHVKTSCEGLCHYFIRKGKARRNYRPSFEHLPYGGHF